MTPTRKAVVALLAILLAFFVALEIKAPYYFLQDDNRDYSLPLWVGSARALAAGEIGQFNFYQSLGMPLLASGQSGGLTPFSYVSVGVSHALLGHPDGAIDIAVFLYFLIGGLGCLYLAGALGLSRWAGLFAAIAWCLAPFNVYVSVSWVLMAPLVAFLPWIFGLTLALYESPRAGTLVALVTAHVLLFFTGYIPWLMFLAVFEIAFLALLAAADLRNSGNRARPRLALPWLVAMPVLAAGFSSPLLLPMAHQMTLSANRAQATSFAVFSGQALRPALWLNGLLLPFWRPARGQVVEWSFLRDAAPPTITHLGYLTLAFALLAGVRLGRRRTLPGRRAVWVAFLVLGTIATLWSFGLFSPLLYRVPIFNRLRWPFRLLPFTNFFLILLAASGFDAWRSRASLPRPPRLVLALLGVQVLNLGAANLVHHHRGFYEHLDPVPLMAPKLPGPGEGRVFTIGIWTPPGGRGPTAGCLGFDYAMLWRIFHFAGYETMMPKLNSVATFGLNHASPEPVGASFLGPPQKLMLDYLRDWGVRWYFVSDSTASIYAPYLEGHGMILADADRERRVYRDDQARPLAFWSASGAAAGIAMTTGANELRLETESESGGGLTSSFLWSPFFAGTVDGARVEVGQNRRGQMEVIVPAGHHVLRLRYSDPFFRIGMMIAALSGCLLAAWAFLRWRSRTVSPS